MLFSGYDSIADPGHLGELEANPEGDGSPSEVSQVLGVVGCTVVFLGLLSCLLICLSKGEETKVLISFRFHLSIFFSKMKM